MAISHATADECASILVNLLGAPTAHKLIDELLKVKGNASFVDNMLAIHRRLLLRHPIE